MREEPRIPRSARRRRRRSLTGAARRGGTHPAASLPAPPGAGGASCRPHTRPSTRCWSAGHTAARAAASRAAPAASRHDDWGQQAFDDLLQARDRGIGYGLRTSGYRHNAFNELSLKPEAWSRKPSHDPFHRPAYDAARQARRPRCLEKRPLMARPGPPLRHRVGETLELRRLSPSRTMNTPPTTVVGMNEMACSTSAAPTAASLDA